MARSRARQRRCSHLTMKASSNHTSAGARPNCAQRAGVIVVASLERSHERSASLSDTTISVVLCESWWPSWFHPPLAFACASASAMSHSHSSSLPQRTGTSHGHVQVNRRYRRTSAVRVHVLLRAATATGSLHAHTSHRRE